MKKHLFIYTILISAIVILSMSCLSQKTTIQNKCYRLSVRDITISFLESDISYLQEIVKLRDAEIIEVKENAEMMIALKPLKDYYSDTEISEIMKEIPRGRIFRGEFNVSANFGESVGLHGKYRQFHTGWDIYATGSDWMITPLAPGEVTNFADDRVYGLNLTIEHSERVQSFYGHGAHVYEQATTGRIVDDDTVIMQMGSTGMSSGPHLHFENRVKVAENKWISIDPKPFVIRD